jgi:hypothetical protein
MSEVRRYDIDENGVCTHQLDGAFVSYEDYALLKAEAERLTKAGDAMADRLMYQGYPATVPAWLAAKEVKQP